jgi:hypothetical protein
VRIVADPVQAPAFTAQWNRKRINFLLHKI